MLYTYQSKSIDIHFNRAIWFLSVVLVTRLYSVVLWITLIDGKYLQWAKPNTHYSNMVRESNQLSFQESYKMFGDFNLFSLSRTVYIELTIYDHFMNIH